MPGARRLPEQPVSHLEPLVEAGVAGLRRRVAPPPALVLLLGLRQSFQSVRTGTCSATRHTWRGHSIVEGCTQAAHLFLVIAHPKLVLLPEIDVAGRRCFARSNRC